MESKTQRILDLFTGEYYSANHDVVEDCILNNHKPEDHEFLIIPKIRLIEDTVNNTHFFNGELIGHEDFENFDFKIFIYSKDNKAIGRFHYPVTSKWPSEPINAKFKKDEEGNYVIYGYYENEKGGKEGFILYLTKLVNINTTFENKSLVNTPVQTTESLSTGKQLSESVILPVPDEKVKSGTTAKNRTQKFPDIVKAAKSKTAAVYYAAFFLSKYSCIIQNFKKSKNDPDISFKYLEKEYKGIVVVSSAKNPVWQFSEDKIDNKTYYLLMHFSSNSNNPDMYILSGKQAKAAILKNGQIDLAYKPILKVKNSITAIIK